MWDLDIARLGETVLFIDSVARTGAGMAIPPLGVHENTLFRGRTGAAEDAWWQLADCNRDPIKLLQTEPE
jgi:hypothetical protein